MKIVKFFLVLALCVLVCSTDGRKLVENEAEDEHQKLGDVHASGTINIPKIQLGSALTLVERALNWTTQARPTEPRASPDPFSSLASADGNSTVTGSELGASSDILDGPGFTFNLQFPLANIIGNINGGAGDVPISMSQKKDDTQA